MKERIRTGGAGHRRCSGTISKTAFFGHRCGKFTRRCASLYRLHKLDQLCPSLYSLYRLHQLCPSPCRYFIMHDNFNTRSQQSSQMYRSASNTKTNYKSKSGGSAVINENIIDYSKCDNRQLNIMTGWCSTELSYIRAISTTPHNHPYLSNVELRIRQF